MNRSTNGTGPGLGLLQVILLLILGCGPAAGDMILAVHPYLDSKDLKQRFQPLADYLSRHLGQTVEVRIGTSYQSHLNAIGLDEVDIAFLGPATYVRMVQRYGPKPLLAKLEADGSPTFRGHIVVPRDSPILELKDLEGKVFAFGNPNSTMSRLVPQAMMERVGLTLDKLKAYVTYPGHNNVAMAVMSGDADAGAVKEEVYRRYQHQGLRSVAESPAIPEHLFVARSNLPAVQIRRVRELLLNLYDRQRVHRFLQPIKPDLSALIPVRDHDYDGLRALLGKLE